MHSSGTEASHLASDANFVVEGFSLRNGDCMFVDEACNRISAGQKVRVCMRVGYVDELNDGIVGSTNL